MSKPMQQNTIRQQAARLQQLQRGSTVPTLMKADGTVDEQGVMAPIPPPPANTNMIYMSEDDEVETGKYTTIPQAMGGVVNAGEGCLRSVIYNTKSLKWITSVMTVVYMAYIISILSWVDVIESKVMIVIAAVMGTSIVFMHGFYIARPIWSKTKDIKNEMASFNWLDVGIYLSTIIFVITEINIYERMPDNETRDIISSFNIIIATFLIISLITARQIHYHNLVHCME